MGNKVSLEEEMINLKIVAKQMSRSSTKCEKNEKIAVEKLKKVRRRRREIMSVVNICGSLYVLI
jgi:hypothetical protein